jgi:hypothetical protein
VPFLIVGATDARFFRGKGVIVQLRPHGRRIPFGEFSKLFHGNNSASIRRRWASRHLWEGVIREVVG